MVSLSIQIHLVHLLVNSLSNYVFAVFNVPEVWVNYIRQNFQTPKWTLI